MSAPTGHNQGMHRWLRLAVALATLAAVLGCGRASSELKGGNNLGLIDDKSSGTAELGYGDGKGDSIGPPGAAEEGEHTTDTREATH